MRRAMLGCLLVSLLAQELAVAQGLGVHYNVRLLGSLGEFSYDAACAINEAGFVAGNSGGAVVIWTLKGDPPKTRFTPAKEQAVIIADINKSGVLAGKKVNVDTGEIIAITIGADGSAKTLAGSGRTGAEALAINDAGAVVGFIRDSNGNSQAVEWESGKTDYLKVATGVAQSSALDINNAGKIVGYCGASAVLWEADGFRKELATPENYTRCIADALNNREGIVGEAIDKAGKSRAIFWKLGNPAVEMQMLPGYDESRAEDINDSGYIVGWLRNGQNETRAVVWNTEGTIADLGSATPQVFSQAFAINKAGCIVGTTRNSAGQIHAVAWVPK